MIIFYQENGIDLIGDRSNKKMAQSKMMFQEVEKKLIADVIMKYSIKQ